MKVDVFTLDWDKVERVMNEYDGDGTPEPNHEKTFQFEKTVNLELNEDQILGFYDISQLLLLVTSNGYPFPLKKIEQFPENERKEKIRVISPHGMLPFNPWDGGSFTGFYQKDIHEKLEKTPMSRDNYAKLISELKNVKIEFVSDARSIFSQAGTAIKDFENYIDEYIEKISESLDKNTVKEIKRKVDRNLRDVSRSRKGVTANQLITEIEVAEKEEIKEAIINELIKKYSDKSVKPTSRYYVALGEDGPLAYPNSGDYFQGIQTYYKFTGLDLDYFGVEVLKVDKNLTRKDWKSVKVLIDGKLVIDKPKPEPERGGKESMSSPSSSESEEEEEEEEEE